MARFIYWSSWQPVPEHVLTISPKDAAQYDDKVAVAECGTDLEVVLLNSAGAPASGSATLNEAKRNGTNCPVLLKNVKDGDRVRVQHQTTKNAWSTDLKIVLKEEKKKAVRWGFIPLEVINGAKLSQRKYGVPASITIAQWAVESEWGSTMPEGSNNPFGIKAVGNQPSVEATTKEDEGKMITIRAKFRKFGSMDEAFDHHGWLLAHNPVYADAMANRNDPDVFANALTGKYASAKNYGAVLITYMKTYHMYQYNE